jgi:predicted transcriptional regulator
MGSSGVLAGAVARGAADVVTAVFAGGITDPFGDPATEGVPRAVGCRRGLRRRYAVGEIDREEFLHRKADLKRWIPLSCAPPALLWRLGDLVSPWNGRRGVRGLGDLEAAIMDVMWAATEPLPVRQVLGRLDRDRDPAYTTVQTVMDILFRKGLVRRELDRRAYRYWAAASREDYVASVMSEALAASVDQGAALATFVEHMDASQVAELRAALQAARAEQEQA